ncbi:MAG: hypothetical protein ACOX21_00390 [Bacillota bacterium]
MQRKAEGERLGRNPVASALKTVAWLIIIIGIVVGLITAIGVNILVVNMMVVCP